MNVTLLIFILVYIAMGFGKLPGFKIDRTGAAVVGALAMMALGSISAQAAWQAMDYKTLGLLFGLLLFMLGMIYRRMDRVEYYARKAGSRKNKD